MSRDDTVAAGRGFLVITGAKVYFILTSTILNFGLPRWLDPARFGEFKVVNTFISILNMVVITGSIQAIAKLIGEDEARSRRLRLQALQLQALVGGTIAGALGIFAEPLCALLFKDASLAPYLRIGAAVTFFYALYAVFIGLLNGLRRFASQAKLDILFSTLKLGLVLGLVVAGFGVLGAFVGFAGAAVLIVLASAVVAHRLPPRGPGEPVPARALVALLAPMLLSTLMMNLLFQLDILGLKGLVSDPIAASLATPEGQDRIAWLLAPLGGTASPDLAVPLAAEAASRLAGLFGGAKNVSLVPYQATVALTFVSVPRVSRATFDADRELAARTVRQSLRFTGLISGLLCTALMATARPVLDVLLGPSYGAGDQALLVLLASTLGLAVLYLCITVLNAAGMAGTALAVSTATVALNGALLVLLLRTAPDLRESVLLRAAIATAGGVAGGLVLALVLLWRRFGTIMPASTLARVLVLGAALTALASLWPISTLLGLVAKAGAVALLFAAGLFVAGELTAGDRLAVRRILGRTSA